MLDPAHETQYTAPTLSVPTRTTSLPTSKPKLSQETLNILDNLTTPYEKLGSINVTSYLLAATEGVAEKIRNSKEPLLSKKMINSFERSRQLIADLPDIRTEKDIQRVAPHIYSLETYARIGELQTNY